jgi:succinoglycan biosynthesis protein ExoM
MFMASAGVPADKLSILVAVLTYKRGDLLEKLLAEFAAMQTPPSSEVTLLVIDNDENGSARALAESFQSRMPALRYVIETRRGIPVARNRGIDEALALNADALCFIDDDEFPHPLWLTNLVRHWRNTGAQLLGGPVEVAAPPQGASWWQGVVNASLAGRQSRKSRQTARAAATGWKYTIVTNNWLCDVDWLRRTGLRFDERLLVTGGSDTAFFREARKLGCLTHWCPDAIVHETITLERLSARYQFWRGASQSMNHFRMKTGRVTLPLMLATAASAALKTVSGALLLVVPVYGIASLVIGLRSIGWAVGRMQAMFGKDSRLYDYPLAPESRDD